MGQDSETVRRDWSCDDVKGKRLNQDAKRPQPLTPSVNQIPIIFIDVNLRHTLKRLTKLWAGILTDVV